MVVASTTKISSAVSTISTTTAAPRPMKPFDFWYALEAKPPRVLQLPALLTMMAMMPAPRTPPMIWPMTAAVAWALSIFLPINRPSVTAGLM